MKKELPPLFDCDHVKPVEKMKVPVSRRGLFSALTEQIDAYKRSTEGVPVYRLEDLAEMNDSAILRVRPVVGKKCKISILDSAVWGTPPFGTEPVKLFSVDSPALKIFNDFNGENEIRTIVERLMAATGWPEEKSKTVVCGLFLKLCEIRICEPK